MIWVVQLWGSAGCGLESARKLSPPWIMLTVHLLSMLFTTLYGHYRERFHGWGFKAACPSCRARNLQVGVFIEKFPDFTGELNQRFWLHSHPLIYCLTKHHNKPTTNGWFVCWHLLKGMLSTQIKQENWHSHMSILISNWIYLFTLLSKQFYKCPVFSLKNQAY